MEARTDIDDDVNANEISIYCDKKQLASRVFQFGEKYAYFYQLKTFQKQTINFRVV